MTRRLSVILAIISLPALVFCIYETVRRASIGSDILILDYYSKPQLLFVFSPILIAAVDLLSRWKMNRLLYQFLIVVSAIAVGFLYFAFVFALRFYI